MNPPPIFFVHIMKTGGSAMGQYLRAQYAADACYPETGDRQFNQKKLSVNRILKLTARDKEAIRFYTLHMPAWVATRVAPDHLRVSVMREPVGRTLSHLKHIARGLDIDNIEAIYDDPRWRDRLSNYQTRIFGLRQSDHRSKFDIFRTLLKARFGLGDPDSYIPLPEGRSLADYPFYTAMDSARPMTAADLKRAIALIDQFDLVGVTEKMDAFQYKLEELTGIEGQIGQVNVAPQSPELPDTLIDRITRDNALDIQLYQHALSLWD